MPAVITVGAQWGDEGKGKVVDFLAEQADVVVRAQGGNNAGHTLMVGGKIYKLTLVPSGILYPGKVCVMGHGMVIDPKVFVNEIDYLIGQGIDLTNLRISPAAHVILPYHVRQDELDEDRKGANKIGTTRRGIGPAYMDKFARIGLRVVDLLDREEFLLRLERNLSEKNALLEKVYGTSGFTLQEIAEPYLAYAERMRPYVAETVDIINDALEAGSSVLFEGAQGNLLDIDFGTYPYVTSSHPVAAGACIGAGVGPTKITRVVGVTKAYTSRVGDGPFPTELLNETGQWLRDRGGEYGTATGRPRRIGWLDLVMVRYTARVSGLSDIALTRLDTLAGLPKLKVCTGYRVGDRISQQFPTGLKALAAVEPVYEDVAGWEDLGQPKRYEDLPATARAYVEMIEEITGVPVSIIGVGRERTEMLVRRQLF